MTYILDLQRLWETSGTKSHPDPTSAIARKKNVVSVIVVAIANDKLLLQTLESVLAQKYIREVIIVNGEDCENLDIKLTAFARIHPKCLLVKTDKKNGLAAAYNLGASHASGQFLLFINGNCILPKHAVYTLLATGIRKPAPWVIGGAEKLNQTPTLAWSRLRKLFGGLEMLHYQNNTKKVLPEVSLPGGGLHTSSLGPECLFLSAQSFLELRGLDRKCFHSTFHVDLCLRIHFAGGGVYSAKEVDIVSTPEPVNLLKDQIREEWQAFRGRLHFYQKYVSINTNNLLKIIQYGALLMRFISRCLVRLKTNLFSASPSI